MKTCTKCGLTKEYSAFYKKNSRVDGRASNCKECCLAQKKNYYRDNCILIKDKRREYVKNNKDLLKENDREYYQKNKHEVLAKKEVYYREHKIEKRQYDIKYRELNKDAIKAKNRKWFNKNVEGNKQKTKLYRKKRREQDPSYKLRCLLADRTRKAIKNQYGIKAHRTMELLGCSIEDARLHLESQFQPGMSWDNHGDWHIDHIRPCASFDLTDPEQQKQCFHFTNLQPLWAEDNLTKSDKILLM